MGGRGSGAKPDERRRREMANLRAQGLSYAEIGRRLGVSRQCVQRLLQRAGAAEPGPLVFRCRACRTPIASVRGPRMHNREAYCLACLARHPEATFGQRLKACRLAAGLTLRQLADTAGMPYPLLAAYERHARHPRWPTIARLVRLLGPDLVTLGLADMQE